VPAGLLMLELLFEPFARMTPRRSRNVALALLSLLLLADVIAVFALIAALVGTSTDELSAGDLLAHGSVVWLTNIITCGLLFWMLDEGGPQRRSEAGRHAPDFRFPQDVDGPHSWMPRLGDYLYVAHQRDRHQPHRHDAADAPGERADGRRVADLLRSDRPRRLARGRRAGLKRLTVLGTLIQPS
jgi:hypothetical protein